jgi:hypothetical protein
LIPESIHNKIGGQEEENNIIITAEDDNAPEVTRWSVRILSSLLVLSVGRYPLE